eukprot:gene16953-18660_t
MMKASKDEDKLSKPKEEDNNTIEESTERIVGNQDPVNVTLASVIGEETCRNEDEGVNTLKEAVKNQLEALFKQSPGREKIEMEEEETALSNEDGSRSRRDFAEYCAKEKDDHLGMAQPATIADDATGKLSMHKQVKLWSEVATDLDTHYLTVLNKRFRTGSLAHGNAKDCSVITSHASESAVDDINKDKGKQRFYSRHDINDDLRLGQLQGTFWSSENSSVHDLIDSLLARTNRVREAAMVASGRGVWVAENSAESESNEVDDGDDDDDYKNYDDECWSESSGSGKSRLQDEIMSDNIIHSSLIEVIKLKENEAKKSQREVEKQRLYISQQHDELKCRLEVINQLKRDNIEIMTALETFESYKLHCDEKSMHQIDEIRKCYNAELDGKQSEILRLKDEINERSRLKDDVKDALLEMAKSRECAVLAGSFANLDKDVEGDCVSGTVLDNAASDCCSEVNRAKDTCKEMDEKSTDEVSGSLDALHERELDGPLVRVIKRFSSALSKFSKGDIITSGRAELADSSPEIVEYLSVEILKELESVFKDNEAKSKEIELVRKGIEINEMETLKESYESTRRKLRRLTEKRYELASLVAEKDLKIEFQADRIADFEKKNSDLLAQNRDLETRLQSAMSDLQVAQDDVKAAREELEIRIAADEGRENESEKLLQFILEDMGALQHDARRHQNRLFSSDNARCLPRGDACCRSCCNDLWNHHHHFQE